MKKDGKYRFTLQFGSDSQDKICVGEFLERLGNRKSQVVVGVLHEYLLTHPELRQHSDKIVVKISPDYDIKMLEQIVQNMIEHRLSSTQMPTDAKVESAQQLQNVSDEDVAQMLDNLELFN